MGQPNRCAFKQPHQEPCRFQQNTGMCYSPTTHLTTIVHTALGALLGDVVIEGWAGITVIVIGVTAFEVVSSDADLQLCGVGMSDLKYQHNHVISHSTQRNNHIKIISRIVSTRHHPHATPIRPTNVSPPHHCHRTTSVR
jgi:glucose uptake protein GlcU